MTDPLTIPQTSDEGGGDAEPPSRICVDIVRESGDWSLFEPVEETVRKAADALACAPNLKFDDSTATLALLSDAGARRLNARYRGIDKPTNVLSFPANNNAPAVEGHAAFLGDIALAAETVAREADEQGLAPAHHLAHLVLHGLLHLLGYDHETGAEAIEMERLETDALARLGIAGPYETMTAQELR